jgi:hypothetical protein
MAVAASQIFKRQPLKGSNPFAAWWENGKVQKVPPLW